MMMDRRCTCAPQLTAMASILERFGNGLVAATSLTGASKSKFTTTKSWFLSGSALPAYGQPEYDFETGHEPNGTALYTCRGHFEGGIHPGSTTVYGECNFGWGGLEQSLSTEYDILTDWNEIIP